MTLELINEQKRMSVLFADTSSYENITGKHPDTYNYYYTSEKNNVFWWNTYPNLFDSGFEVSNSTKQGINEDGTTFYQNSWGGIKFTITFNVVLNKTFNTLRNTIRYKNKPLKVIVTDNDGTVYTNYFILNSTGIEAGKLELISAYSGDGAYWLCGESINKFYLKSTEPYYVQDHPNMILGANTDKFKFDVKSELETPVIITASKIYYNRFLEEYDPDTYVYKTECKLTHLNSGFEYDFIFVDWYDVHVFNSNNFEHTLNGHTAYNPPNYIVLSGGNDEFELDLKTTRTDISTSVEEIIETKISSEAFISIEYKDVRSAIYVK